MKIQRLLNPERPVRPTDLLYLDSCLLLRDLENILENSLLGLQLLFDADFFDLEDNLVDGFFVDLLLLMDFFERLL